MTEFLQVMAWTYTVGLTIVVLFKFIQDTD
jgi:hypothetical protein